MATTDLPALGPACWWRCRRWYASRDDYNGHSEDSADYVRYHLNPPYILEYASLGASYAPQLDIPSGTGGGATAGGET
jgi:hypothetical protein